jgi:enterochelin esterase-like enzyme
VAHPGQARDQQHGKPLAEPAAPRPQDESSLELPPATDRDDSYAALSLPEAPLPFLPEHPQAEDSATPHPRLRLHQQFRSDILPDARNLIIYLPPQYAESHRHFPVLYLHDGQNLFDGRTSYIPGRTWQVQQTADTAIEAGEVEPLIIVGIYNTGPRRIAEYTPTRDWKMGGGEANAYGRLIVEELMPFIGKHYRTLKAPEHTGVGGSSLGGLVSLYLGIEHPQVFGRLAVHSPSVWWNHRSILGLLRNLPAEHHARTWLDVGDAEGARTLEDTNRLFRQMLKQGWREELDLHYEVCPGGTHDETAWAGRVGPMLRFLFPQR